MIPGWPRFRLARVSPPEAPARRYRVEMEDAPGEGYGELCHCPDGHPSGLDARICVLERLRDLRRRRSPTPAPQP